MTFQVYSPRPCFRWTDFWLPRPENTRTPEAAAQGILRSSMPCHARNLGHALTRMVYRMIAAPADPITLSIALRATKYDASNIVFESLSNREGPLCQASTRPRPHHCTTVDFADVTRSSTFCPVVHCLIIIIIIVRRRPLFLHHWQVSESQASMMLAFKVTKGSNQSPPSWPQPEKPGLGIGAEAFRFNLEVASDLD